MRQPFRSTCGALAGWCQETKRTRPQSSTCFGPCVTRSLLDHLFHDGLVGIRALVVAPAAEIVRLGSIRLMSMLARSREHHVAAFGGSSRPYRAKGCCLEGGGVQFPCYAFLLVPKVPAMVTSRTMGVIRTKTHSNPWSNVAATAYSGLEKSHSRYELPIVASAMRTGAVATPIAMQGAWGVRRLIPAPARPGCSAPRAFLRAPAGPSGSDAGTVSPGSVLTGASSALPSATSVSASGTERPRSHLETVCLTTFSLSASSSCDSPFDFLRAWMFSFSMADPFSRPVPTLPQCCPQMVRCRKQRVVTSAGIV